MNTVSIQKIRDLYYSSYVPECIEAVDEFLNQKQELNEYFLALCYLGRCQFEQNNSKQAIATFTKLFEERKKQKGDKIDETDMFIAIMYQFNLLIVDSIQADDNNIQFKQICDSYMQQSESNPSFHQGMSLFGQGMFQSVDTLRDDIDTTCINTLTKALELSKDFEQLEYEIIYTIANVYFEKEQFDLAIEWCEKLYQKNPRYIGVANCLGLFYQNKPNKEKALFYFEQAEKFNPNSTIVLINISYFYVKDQQTQEKAFQCLNKAYLINPSCSKVNYELGYHLYHNNALKDVEARKLKGLKLMQKALELDPYYYEVYITLSNIEISEGRREKGMEYLEKCGQMNPRSGFVLYRLGNEYYSIQEYMLAIHFFELALKVKLSFHTLEDTYQFLAFAYQKIGKHEEFIRNLIGPINSKYHSKGGIVTDIYLLAEQLDSQLILPNNNKKIQIIFSIFGPFQQKLEILKRYLRKNEDVRDAVKCRLDLFRQTLSLLAYQKNIPQNLQYKNKISHWDLFI